MRPIPGRIEQKPNSYQPYVIVNDKWYFVCSRLGEYPEGMKSGKERFPQYDDIMEAVDKVDSGNLTVDEILNPTGWILVGFLMDPRTGLGRWRQFTIVAKIPLKRFSHSQT